MTDLTRATVRWGIIGSGTPRPHGHSIAHAFARGLALSETGGLLAIGSRDQAKADDFGDLFGVPRRYGSYEALLADPDVEAVYIALPNHLHAEWAIASMRAGKHVLCEKPLTLNAAEAMRVVDEARRRDVFLMEAFMYRCHPQTKRLKELLDEGAIGEVRSIEAAFSYDLGPTDENVRASNRMGGGGIMDVGCYTLSMARLIAGAEPVKISGVARIGARTRVDDLAAATLVFPNGILATVNCGLAVRMDPTLRVWGSSGSLVVPNPWQPVAGTNRIIVTAAGSDEPREVVVEASNDRFALEADTVARHIAARQAPEVSWEDTLGNMAALDAWRRSAGLVFDRERPGALRAPAPAVRADARMTYGTMPGMTRPISRLMMGTVSFNIDALPLVCTLLDEFVALGGNAIETAHSYGRGTAERAVGQWLALRDNRQDIVLTTKGCREEVLGQGLRVTPAAISSDLADSLERLQTDYIDLYLLHTDDPGQPVGPIVECLNEHYQAGRIRAFGASNWSTERLQAANDYATSHGLVPFAVGSPNLSLAVWNEPPWPGCLSASAEDLDWYTRQQFALLSWSSQAQGFFTGRYNPEDRSNPDMVRCWYNAENFARLERARAMAREKGVSPTAVVLAYVLCQPFPTFAAIGPRTLEELRTSAEALSVSLTARDLDWLRGRRAPSG